MTDADGAAAEPWRAEYLKRLSALSRNQLMALALKLKQQVRENGNDERGGCGPAEPIAIVGVGCRFPGAVTDAASYWELLRNAGSGVVEMVDERWNMQAYFAADPEAGGKIHSRAFGLVDAVDRFDADFFGISPREAESMDPQQRLLLEVVWEAIESSGHACAELEGSAVGVFVGMMNKDYLHLNLPDMIGAEARHSPFYASGEAFSIAAGRLSYLLGLHGPSLTLDTACSSSLVAVHLACQSLLQGECDAAIAGGSSLILSPEASIVSSNARMLSASGQCWSFDERADGYVRGEGCAVVVLKRLSAARRDGDPVLATIVSSAVNHDGRSQGLTAPSVAAQIALARTALEKAGLSASSIGYVEAHGTGTPLGDPIEMNSIQSVYAAQRDPARPLYVGSVKANIGHTEASAGISGLIKLALCIAHREIVAQPNFQRLNPHIRLQPGVEIATRRQRWESAAQGVYGAVSSFGFSGTNAHLILRGEESPSAVRDDAGAQLLTLSATTDAALHALVEKYRDYLASAGAVDLADLAYTMNVGRNPFRERLAIRADDVAAVQSALAALASGGGQTLPPGCFRGRADAVQETVLVFAAPAEPVQCLAALVGGSAAFAAVRQRLLDEASAALGRDLANMPDDLAPRSGGDADRDEFGGLLLHLTVFHALAELGIAAAAVAGDGFAGRLAAVSAAGLISADKTWTCFSAAADERRHLLQAVAPRSPRVAVIDLATGIDCTDSLRDAGLAAYVLQGRVAAAAPAAAASPAGSDRLLLWLGGGQQHRPTPAGRRIGLFDAPTVRPDWPTLLGSLYAAGLTIRWTALYRGQTRRRLVLPTYAFQRRRYWPRNSKTESLRRADPAAAAQDSLILEWRRATPAGTSGGAAATRYFVLAEGAPAGAAAAPDVPALQPIALAGEWWTRNALQQQLAALRIAGQGSRVVLALWLAGAPAAADREPDAVGIVARCARVGEALLNLTQLLLETEAAVPLRLCLITVGAESCLGAASNLADSIVGGFARAAALEQPQLALGTVDLDPHESRAAQWQGVLAELRADDGETQVALRAGQRYVRRLATAPPTPASPRPLRADRAYLVTGGLGGIGLATARWLAAGGAGEILLLSRRAPDADTVRTALQTLRADAVRVRFLSADIGDWPGLRDALEQAAALPLAGIVHAAGTLDDASLQNLTPAHFAGVLHAKVAGALNLQRLAADRTLDFFLLFSSVAQVIGSAGQANYASANGFAAALAHWRREQGLPASVIHWGPWAEVGMASALRLQRKLTQSGLVPLPPDAAVAAMAAALAQPQAEHVIGRFDWPRVAAYLADRAPLHLLADFLAGLAAAAPAASWGDALRAASLPPSRKELGAHVAATVRQVLGLDESDHLDESRSLQELGMDSLLSVELRNRFAAALRLTLPVSLMFDYPSVAALSTFLLAELTAQPPLQAAAAAGAERVAAAETGEDIAVIGVGCRFPGGADNPDALWKKLVAGEDLVTPFDGTRWDVDRFYAEGSTEDGMMYANFGGQLANVHAFDNDFFGIGDREAEYMDPQQRIVLEVAWETIESAAYTPQQLAAGGGLFIGPGPSDFAQLSQRHARALTGLMGPGHHLSAIPGRVAYLLDWQGPCMVVDTACSSSLVAIHLAAQHLRQRECDVALAGGVNVILSPANNIVLSKAGMLSPAGKCRTFDQDADGYVRSDGCGLVLLKRLGEALADGDHVWGVIKGSAVNQNGHGQGITAPSGRQQVALIDTALARARVHPRSVRYVEAHGTGTQLGDPIEVHALMHTYGRHHTAANPLYLGAVKSNIGHTESAAGVAGLIKTLLILKHGLIPPNLHITRLNPLLDLDADAVRIPTSPQPLHDDELICAVSSFGFSGSNAHLIVQRVAAHPRERRWGCGVFALSAKNASALAALCRRYLRYLGELRFDAMPLEEARRRIADVCYSSLVGRSRFDAAICLYPADAADLIAQLQRLEADLRATPAIAATARRVLALQLNAASCAPTPGVDSAFYRRHRVFAERVDAIDALTRELAGLSVRDHLLASAAPPSPRLTRLAGFCLESALQELLAALGVEISAVEYADERGRSAGTSASLREAVAQLCTPDADAEPALAPAATASGDASGILGLLLDDGSRETFPGRGERLDDDALQRLLGTLWAGGWPVDVRAFYRDGGLQRVVLPTYPFQRRDCARPQGLAKGERPVAQLLQRIRDAG